MGREMVEEAVEILDQNARDRGHVVGFNVIFMESSFVDPNTPVQVLLLPSCSFILFTLMYLSC